MPPDRPRMRVLPGPRACEAALLEDLDLWLERPLEERLTRRALVVVPSRSLRLHLLERIAARSDRAVLGLSCRTLRHVAVDAIERAEGPPAINDELPALLAMRFARRETALRRALDGLRDGYRPVGAAVCDLLEAGLELPLVEAAEEALESEGGGAGSRAQLARAFAVVRVAGRVAEALEASGIESPASLLLRAATAVRSGAGSTPEIGHLSVYGFGDATGAASDLIVALLEAHGGAIYLDHPPDPAGREATDRGVAFTSRFAERIAARAPESEASATPRPEPPRIEMFRAVGATSEIREVARRARALIDGGAAPEEIALVARRLEPYRVAVREQFAGLGLPFSGVGSRGPLTAGGRRAAALLELLTRGEAVSVDRWLEIQRGLAEGTAGHLLRQALLCLGAGRLGEAATLAFEPLLRDGAYRLPLGRGLASIGGDADDAGDLVRQVRLRQTEIDGERLAVARERARGAVRRIERLRSATTAGELRRTVADLVARDLAWPEAECRRLDAVLAAASRGLSDAEPLDHEELIELLRPTLEVTGAEPVGGQGGGVRVLDVIEARGRTFLHLFLVGLQRGVFPRPVHEDPLLPDRLRDVLARTGHGVLPDLAPKTAGFAEERYLFAQLLDSAPHVVLSWQEADDDGSPQTPSPLVERLRWSEGAPDAWRDPPVAAHVLSRRAADDTAPRPAREIAILAGLYGDRAQFSRLLPAALEEAGRTSETARRVAAARLRVLAELDPDLASPEGRAVRAAQGPYLGWIGPVGELGDPRSGDARGELPVTTLESLARCPWQTFLGRLLRLEPSADPLDLLPEIDARLVGNLVHQVLEELAREQLGPRRPLAEAIERSPPALRWPEPKALDALLARAAARQVADEGIALPGFDRALAEVARPYLEQARLLDWPDGRGPHALEVEASGEVVLEDGRGRARKLRFRADRVDRRDDTDGLVFTDFKTGLGRIVESGKERKALLDGVRSGHRLQAAAYAAARGVPADAGRYLHLHPAPRAVEPARELMVEGSDREVIEAFLGSARVLLDAWDGGLFFPRLVYADKDEEPSACGYCSLAEACLRHDSGIRIRLRDWSSARHESGAEPADDAERAWLAAWGLATASPGGRRR